MNGWISFAIVTLCRVLVLIIAIGAIPSLCLAQSRKSFPAQKWRQPPQAAGPELVHSPWTKFCITSQEPNTQQVCFTGTDGRHKGAPVVAAVLIEPEKNPRRSCVSPYRSAC